MKLSPPKQLTFIIALVLGLLGLLGSVAGIPVVAANQIWFLAAGFVILVAGVLVKGL